MNYQTPEAVKVAEMLTMVLGVEAAATPGTAADAATLSYVATYVNREDELVASCSCSLPTAAALGCALSMIPPGGAEAMVEDGGLTATATENFYEMMNIFSSLLMNDKTAHLRLQEVAVDADKRMQGDGLKEAAFDLTLGSYGKGCVVFCHS